MSDSPQATMTPSDPSRMPPAPTDGFAQKGDNSVAPSQSATSLSPSSIQSGGNCMLRRGGNCMLKSGGRHKSHKKHSRKSHKKHSRKSSKKHSGKSHRKHRK
jgi:hypothetical protein